MTISIANLPEEQRPTTVEFANYQMDDDAFYDFCRQNEHLKFEREPNGIITAMPNTGGKTGNRNTKIISRLDFWSESFGGLVFDSSTAFKFPNGAVRSPDAAWISDARWDSLTASQQEKFPPIAPEFVVELMSATDSIANAKEKMQEYITNNVLLGWLIDPKNEEVMIYRADGTISRHTNFEQPITGEDVLPGFEFNLRLLLR
ncbi:Uma2 family endonuclease [Spirosoma sp. KCTC 42546]|uniref:Uma2 family endonuclease n=1 Tax=Spirosoma sp. KCTC 42546 TaxID=2520506 RepID=UPI00115B800A|nr:Uma2 family endonuclease [Spirosoma sp. KCTC 42546]QDK79850.1 Uma2 family endonuclease [Spirosoma sp. KCTC 42546]